MTRCKENIYLQSKPAETAKFQIWPIRETYFYTADRPPSMESGLESVSRSSVTTRRFLTSGLRKDSKQISTVGTKLMPRRLQPESLLLLWQSRDSAETRLSTLGYRTNDVFVSQLYLSQASDVRKAYERPGFFQSVSVPGRCWKWGRDAMRSARTSATPQ